MEALQRLHNRGSISTGFDIDNSCKFQRDSEYLKAEGRSQGTQTTWTYSTWVKRTDLSDTNEPYQNIFSAGSSSSNWCHAYFRGDGSYPDNQIFLYLDNGGSQYWLGRILESFRDTSAWLHFVLAVDTTQSTTTDRAKVYINGVQKTISNFTAPTQNASTRVGDGGGKFAIGALTDASHSFNGYIAECVLVDGSQLAPTSFGEFDDDSGIWKPKDVSSLSLGTTGFYINFDDSSDMGKVTSGNNGGNFDKYSIDSTNQATDTPTNNFATGLPLLYFSTATTVSEGATKIAKGANGWEILASTMAVTRGKWYVEVRNETMPESAMASIMPDDIELIFRGGQTLNYPGKIVGDEGQGYYSYNGKYYRNGHYEDYGASWTGSTNTIGIALDMDNGKLYFAKDNTWQNSGDPTSGSTGTGAIDVLAPTKPHLIGYTPYAANTDGFINFGGYTGASISSAASDADGYGTFEYAPPSGYYALCTKNLEEYG